MVTDADDIVRQIRFADWCYNSPMEVCVVICHVSKPAKRRGRVIFIEEVNEETRERSISNFKPEHQERVSDARRAFKDVEGFAKVASTDSLKEAVKAWDGSSVFFKRKHQRST
ncbi:MAG: hypothetical protein HY867_19280 [Chloroflexi bacterium]|nr:hypothetical protein [Chloroflexota bacterium]